ncbi:MAG: DUF2341 domain-containing protein [Candidatus Paceibacterota bacterium]
MNRKNIKKFLIASAVFLFLLFFVFYFSQNIASKNGNIVSEKEASTIFSSISIEPNKIKVGEIQTTRIEIESQEKIEKISAQIPFEGSYDEIALRLIDGDNFKGIWEGQWTAHNTLAKEYETTIIAITASGKTETGTATWWDDTETGWLEGWKERRKLTLTETSGATLTDYQVPVDLTGGVSRDGLVGQWKFSEGTGTTAYDTSGEGNDGTISGADYTADKEGNANAALSFDGVDDYVDCGNDESLNITDEITISTWVKTSQSKNYQRISDKLDVWQFYTYTTTGNLGSALYTSSGNYGDKDSGKFIADGIWHNVILVYNGSYIRFYVDGIKTPNEFSQTGTLNINTNDVYIGNRGTLDRGFQGSIDDVRIYNRALSEDEIEQLYLEGEATGLYDNSGLVGSWHFSEGAGTTAYDTSGSANHGTLTNGPTWTTNKEGEAGKAMSFDGVDDYVDCGNDESLRITNNLAVSFWFKNESTPDLRDVYIGRYQVNNEKRVWAISYTGGIISYWSKDGAVGVGTSNLAVEPNVWYHFTATFESGLVKQYLNGELKSTNDISATVDYLYDTDTKLVIGARDEGVSYFLPADIDSVRIYNRALSEDEIRQLYGEGKARLDLSDLRFTAADGTTNLPYWLENDSKAWVKIPSLPASAATDIYYYFGNPTATAASSTTNTFIREISGLAAGWNFNEGTGTTAYDTSGNANTGTLTNSPTWTTDKNGTANSAIAFDGVDDYVDAGNGASLDFGTGEVSFEAWVNIGTQTEDYVAILDKSADNDWTDVGVKLGFWLGNRSGALGNDYLLQLGDGTSTSSISPDSVSFGALNNAGWTHIVGTVDAVGGSPLIKAYKNSSLVSSTSRTLTGSINTTYNLNIGQWRAYSRNLAGSVDNIRIYNKTLSADEISDVYNNAVYATPTYPGFALVHKYASSAPTTSILAKEENRPTSSGTTGVSGGGPMAF